MSPVEVITSVQRRSIQINFLGGGVFSMKGALQAARSEEPLVPLS